MELSTAQNEQVNDELALAKKQVEELSEKLTLLEAKRDELQNHCEKESRLAQKKVEELVKQTERLTEQKAQLSAENEVIKAELKSYLAAKQSTQKKLQQLTVDIGLTASESRHLMQEMESFKLQNEELNKVNSQVMSENELLRDQCKQHSKHCLLLIKENKRLMERITTLKSSLSDEDSTNKPALCKT